MINVQEYSKTHRTAVVVDIRDGFTNPFKERVNRLVESVNGSNIKVDFFTLSGSGLSAGAPSTSSPTPSWQAEAEAAGWTLKPGLPSTPKPFAMPSGDILAELKSVLVDFDQIVVSTS